MLDHIGSAMQQVVELTRDTLRKKYTLYIKSVCFGAEHEQKDVDMFVVPKKKMVRETEGAGIQQSRLSVLGKKVLKNRSCGLRRLAACQTSFFQQ